MDFWSLSDLMYIKGVLIDSVRSNKKEKKKKHLS